MIELVGYKEAVDCVEKFLKETGIKNICTTICKGVCCGTCWYGHYACHRNEGIRLGCSTFLCYDLQRAIEERNNYIENKHSLYRHPIINLMDLIRKQIRQAMGENSYNRNGIYFRPHTDETIGVFRIDVEVLNSISEHTDMVTKSISDAMNDETFIKFLNNQREKSVRREKHYADRIQKVNHEKERKTERPQTE